MKEIKALSAKNLCQRTDPTQFNFETTDEIRDLTEFVGQARALEAIQFGIEIKNKGYNLFVMGPSGIGKHSVIKTVLDGEASQQSIPSDWCYIHNFLEPRKPIAIQLPTGLGSQLKHDMEDLVDDLKTSIPITFESEEYRAQLQKINDEINEKQEKILDLISAEAKKEGLVIHPSPQGFTVFPVDNNGKIINSEDFENLSEEIRTKKEEKISEYSHKLANFLKKIPHLNKERREREKEIRKEFTFAAVGRFIDDLKKKYKKVPSIISYLNEVQDDVILNVKDFIKQEEGGMFLGFMGAEKLSLSRYQINVLVDNSTTKGAPVIYEEHPSYANVICRVEHIAQFGALITDFTLIKPGKLHLANGGYLILDAEKILFEPFAWEGLKRALYNHKITIEAPERLMGLLSTVSLDPMPIPLNLKVILLGNRRTYYLLSELDPDFSELFKVVADFEEEINRTKENTQIYARLIKTFIHKNNLLPFHRTAVASAIDRYARLAENQEKLSTHMRSIHDLVRESNYFAEKDNSTVVKATHVSKAIEAQVRRQDRIREYMYEEIFKNIIMINTEGIKTGEINALSITELGGFRFGHPSRITASIHLGKGEVIDIQREVKLGGPIHSKGVLILSGFLSGRYTKDELLSISASIVFEQTYGFVEGDSASVAELCVLLSGLANVPIKQSIAVTGSINQHGEVQAVGGVNEKIEGYFDICKGKGLTGQQAVIIPASNVKHLMLREDVIEAASKKKFHIYAVSSIDEAIEILTDLPAGKRSKYGLFPIGSINARVEQCLEKFYKNRKRKRTKIIRK